MQLSADGLRVLVTKAHALGVSEAAFREQFLATTSLRSTVTAQDVANMALFLCTDAGKRMTGQALAVDGDVRYLV